MKHLIQGSAEWKEWRRDKIGSSDAAIIMGISPYKTPYQLWEQKLSGQEDFMNDAMKAGVRLESRARDIFIETTEIFVEPDVKQAANRPWQIASLDGISKQGTTIIEVKCSENLYKKACESVIPEIYQCQMQHIMSVTGLNCVWYVAYSEELDKINFLKFDRDPDFIAELVKKEEEFYKFLQTKEPPPLSDADYQPFEHSRGSDLLKEYIALGDQEKQIKSRRDALKEELLEISPKRNFIIDGVKIYETRNTSYDTKRMKEDGLPIDAYKKLSNPYWMIAAPRRRSA